MRKYKVSIHGYGCEATIGSVNEEIKKKLSDPDRDLVEIVDEDLDEYGRWYGIDDQFHRWGASSTYTIEVTDENGDTIIYIDSENLGKYDDEEFQLIDYEYAEIDESKDLLMCVSFEKGSFFEGDIETEEDFDIKKMKIRIDSEIGIKEYYYGDIVSAVLYDDEEIDNYGGTTDGKSFEVYKNF